MGASNVFGCRGLHKPLADFITTFSMMIFWQLMLRYTLQLAKYWEGWRWNILPLSWSSMN